MGEVDPSEEAERAILPMLRELAEAGFDTDDPYLLPDDKASVERYSPILIKWLPLVRPWLAKYWLVSALASPHTVGEAVDVLIDEFRLADRFADDPDGMFQLRWSISDALERMGPAVPVDRMVQLLDNPEWRSSAVLVATALGRAARRKGTAGAAAAALTAVLRDPTVARYAVQGLASGRLRVSPEDARELRPLVARYLDDTEAWAQKSAQRALDKLDACL